MLRTMSLWLTVLSGLLLGGILADASERSDGKYYTHGSVLDLSGWRLSETLTCHVDVVTDSARGKIKTHNFPKLKRLMKERGEGLFFEWPKTIVITPLKTVTDSYKEGVSVVDRVFPDTLVVSIYPKFKGLAVAGVTGGRVIHRPVIDSYSGMDGFTYDSAVVPGGIVQLHGRYFGRAAPRVWLEFPTAKGAIRRLTCSPQRPYLHENCYGAAAKGCMDVYNGMSCVNVRLPKKYPKDFVHGDTVVMVIHNGIALDSIMISTCGTQPGAPLIIGDIEEYIRKGNYQSDEKGVLTLPILSATDASGRLVIRDPHGAKLSLKSPKTVIPDVASFKISNTGELKMTFKKNTGGVNTHILVTVIDKVSKRSAELRFYVKSMRDDRFPEAMKRFRDDFAKLEGSGSPGGYAVMIDNNNFIFSDGYGTQSFTDIRPITDLTIFPLGTMSELYTATAVMYLVQTGKLKINAKVIDYLMGYPWKDKRYADLRLTHLLSHTSGLDGNYLPYSETRVGGLSGEYDSRAFANLHLNKPLVSNPNTMVRHSADNYVLLHRMVEAMLSRKADFSKLDDELRQQDGYMFSEYITNRILAKKVYMKHTYHEPYSTPPAEWLARGYVDAMETQSTTPLYANNAAGMGFYSNPVDMCRLARALMPKAAEYGEIFGFSFKISGKEGLLTGKWADKMEEKYPTGNNTGKIGNVAFTRGLGWDNGKLDLFKDLKISCSFKLGETSEHVSLLLSSRSTKMAVALCVCKPVDIAQVEAIAQRFLINAIREKDKDAKNKLESAIKNAAKYEIPGDYAPSPPTNDVQEKVTGIFANATDVYLLEPYDKFLSLKRKRHGEAGWEEPVIYRYRVGKKYAVGDPENSDEEYEPALYPASKSSSGTTRDYILLYTVDKAFGINEYHQAWLERPPETGPADAALRAAWEARTTDTWLLVNDHYMSGRSAENAFFTLFYDAELFGEKRQGYVLLGNGKAEMLLQMSSSTKLVPNLSIPGKYGSGMREVTMYPKDGAEWMQVGELHARPASSCPLLTSDTSLTLTVGSDLYWEWARVDTGIRYINFAEMSNHARWMVFDVDGALLGDSLLHNTNVIDCKNRTPGYIVFKGEKHATVRVSGQ